jgi:hypothetical protein
MKVKAKIRFKTLNNTASIFSNNYLFQKGSIESQSPRQLKDTFAKAKYEQYEKGFYVPWSFHIELPTRTYKSK